MGTKTAIQEKPLNQSQLKNLQQLVSGDFVDLRARLLGQLEERKSKLIEEINERFDKQTDLSKMQESLVNEARKAEDRLKKVVEKALEKDVQISGGRTVFDLFSVSVYPNHLVQKGREEEVKKVEKATSRLKDQVVRVLGREERGVQRQVLLQGISAQGAMELINDLPKPEEILALVTNEISSTSQDDLELVMGDVVNEARAALENGDDE